MSTKVDELPSYFVFQISSNSTDRTVRHVHVFRRKFCKWTLLFAAATFCISPAPTNSLNNPRSGKTNVTEWTSHIIIWFSTWKERLSTAIRLSSGFNSRRRRHFVLPTIPHYFTADNFDAVSPSVSIPCARRLITQYFRYYSAVHLICTAALSGHVQGYRNSHSGSDLEKYIDWKLWDRRQQKNSSCLSKPCVHFLNCISCLLPLFRGHVTNYFFFFRSRSYPVPHRGERVKQRTVQARNWFQYYRKKKPSFRIFYFRLHAICFWHSNISSSFVTAL